MKYLMICILLMLALTNCRKPASNAVPILNGTYQGTFQRKTQGNGASANITLQFAAGNWSGTGDQGKYPALCRGTFIQTGDSLKVTNTCIWTAEFDWTLIFNGAFAVKADGNNITFTKTVNANTQDIYVLTRQ